MSRRLLNLYLRHAGPTIIGRKLNSVDMSIVKL